MVEIALSLAVIGIALVAILGVLPIGLRMQRENREQTLINQDATVLMEHIRNGTHSPLESDLTNYVYAISNTWTRYNANGSVVGPLVNGYTLGNYSVDPQYYSDGRPLTSNSNIIGLLSTPEFTDANGQPVPCVMTNGVAAPVPGLDCYSNHVVAYVRAMSGSAIDRPPQDNGLLRDSSLFYRVVCQNLPTPVLLPPQWSAGSYSRGAQVYNVQNGQIQFWRSLANANTDTPGSSLLWERDGYTTTLMANARELRLTFLWPELPSGKLGKGNWTYRVSVAGDLLVASNSTPAQIAYFFRPQSFTTNAP